MRISIFCLTLLLAMSCVSQASAQNFFRDFVVNNPRSFGPDDPWTTGVIFRNRVGWGGLFFNCDGEECKRFSPYIEWNRQSTCCHPKAPVARGIGEQIREIRQRIRWGACCDDDCCDESVQYGEQTGYYAENEAEVMTEETAPASPPVMAYDDEFSIQPETAPEAGMQTQAVPRTTAIPATSAVFQTPSVPQSPVVPRAPETMDSAGTSYGGVQVMTAVRPQILQTPATPRVSKSSESQPTKTPRTSSRDETFRMLK